MTRSMALPLLLAAIIASRPASAFECSLSATTANSVTQQFDLAPLSGQRLSTKETDTPPTKSEARAAMSLCGTLDKDGSKSDEDQCPPGTKVCLTMLNHKTSSDEASRITAVIPIWTESTPDGDVTLTAMNQDEGLEISVAGEMYAGSRQNLLLRLYCSPGAVYPNPELIAYNDNLLTLQWSTPDACPRGHIPGKEGGSGSDGGDGSGESEGEGGGNGSGDQEGKVDESGMGVRWFFNMIFWLSVLGLLAYFGIGIYYNYTTYGSKGLDLLPHKEFWLDLPGMIRDLVAHLIAGFRGRGGGGGGISIGNSGSGGSGRGGYTAL